MGNVWFRACCACSRLCCRNGDECFFCSRNIDRERTYRTGNMKKWISLLLAVCLLAASKTPAFAQETVPSLETPRAAVMEVTTGQILFEKEGDARAHPASVTKLMTVLLAFEALESGKITLKEEVVTSAHAKSMGGSQVFLEEGEVQTVETLLKCVLIASGNDASVALAEHISGTEEAFVARMNEEAERLGMANTHFVDCCGLTDSKEHFTSARDVAILSGELLRRYPQVTEYSDIWMEDITHVTRQGSSLFTLANTNKLLRSYPGCDGLKTGSTSQAGFCLSATARREGIRLVSVVLGAPDSKTRFQEAGDLLNYGFSRCSLYYDESMEDPGTVNVRGGKQEEADLIYETEFSYLSTSGEDFSQIEKELLLEKELKAPVKKGQQAGTLVYTLGDKKIGEVSVLTAEAVEATDYPYALSRVLSGWLLSEDKE